MRCEFENGNNDPQKLVFTKENDICKTNLAITYSNVSQLPLLSKNDYCYYRRSIC